MSNGSTTTRQIGPARDRRTRDGNAVSRFFGAIGLFIRQILDEMRKVVRPTRKELTTYTTVVIVFVVAIMLYVLGLDTLFTKLVFWVFAGS